MNQNLQRDETCSYTSLSCLGFSSSPSKSPTAALCHNPLTTPAFDQASPNLTCCRFISSSRIGSFLTSLMCRLFLSRKIWKLGKEISDWPRSDQSKQPHYFSDSQHFRQQTEYCIQWKCGITKWWMNENEKLSQFPLRNWGSLTRTRQLFLIYGGDPSPLHCLSPGLDNFTTIDPKPSPLLDLKGFSQLLPPSSSHMFHFPATSKKRERDGLDNFPTAVFVCKPVSCCCPTYSVAASFTESLQDLVIHRMKSSGAVLGHITEQRLSPLYSCMLKRFRCCETEHRAGFWQ